jgi:hypothetical protein
LSSERERNKRKSRLPGTSLFYASYTLAAGAGIVIPAATAAPAVAAVAAAAPNDNQQNDDPTAVTATKTIITHTEPPKKC